MSTEYQALITETAEKIRHACGRDGKLIMLLSADAQCMLCAAIASQTLGERFYGVFADNGLLREGEAEEILTFYRSLDMTLVNFKDDVRTVYRLVNLSKPAQKRTAIQKEREYILTSIAKRHHCYHLLLTAQDVECGMQPDRSVFSQVITPFSQTDEQQINQMCDAMRIKRGTFTKNQPSVYGLALSFCEAVTPGVLQVLRRFDQQWRLALEQQGCFCSSSISIDRKREDGTYCLTLSVSPATTQNLSKALESYRTVKKEFAQHEEIGEVLLKLK